jgi:signal transduction histidine kinase
MKLIRDKEKTAKPDDKVVSVTEKTPASSQILRRQSAKKPNFLPTTRSSSSWKILVVDDEPEVHAVTKLTLGDLKFEEKPVQLLSAMSGKEAQEILKQEPNIAVALIDVVMETEDAGLRLVNYIRTELNDQRIRLIIRTGQPGVAPERYVIDHYDIDDYKDKTELTAERLYTTLRTTLKAYRDLTLELKQTHLVPTIAKAISFNRFLAQSKQIRLNFDSDDNIPQMRVDVDKIQQVLNNLISNAIKYSHPQTTVQIRATRKQNDVLISVTDSGQGIPKSEFDKLFKAFSKTSVKSTDGENSTGLGLLICRQIVEAHSGKIWLESQVGVGSTFYVLLPIHFNNSTGINENRD